MTTVALSYEDLASRLAISVPSARRLVQRRRWSKALGNDGKAVVTVPVEFLAQRDSDNDNAQRDDVTTVPTTDLPTDPATVVETVTPTVPTTDLTTELVARLMTVQAEMAEMARKLGAAEGELRAMRDERDHLRHLLDRQSRPWWRRAVGY